MAKKTMTFTQYARHRGVTPAAVHQAVKRGECPVIGKRRRRIDPLVADQAWHVDEDQQLRGRGMSDERPEFHPWPWPLVFALDRAVVALGTKASKKALLQAFVHFDDTLHHYGMSDEDADMLVTTLAKQLGLPAE